MSEAIAPPTYDEDSDEEYRPSMLPNENDFTRNFVGKPIIDLDNDDELINSTHASQRYKKTNGKSRSYKNFNELRKNNNTESRAYKNFTTANRIKRASNGDSLVFSPKAANHFDLMAEVVEAETHHFTVYHIKLKWQGHKWTVVRRYSQFSDLNVKISSIISPEFLMPPKTFFRKTNEDFVEKRRCALDHYVKSFGKYLPQILSARTLRKSFVKFINPTEAADISNINFSLDKLLNDYPLATNT